MSNINKIFLIGKISQNPEIKEFKTGGLVTNTKILTIEKNKNSKIFNWHRVIFYNNLAKLVKKFVNKGDLVFIQGRLNNRKWIDNEEKTRYISEIISNEIKILKKNENNEMENNKINDLKYFDLEEKKTEEKPLIKISKDIIDEIEKFSENEEYFENSENEYFENENLENKKNDLKTNFLKDKNIKSWEENKDEHLKNDINVNSNLDNIDDVNFD